MSKEHRVSDERLLTVLNRLGEDRNAEGDERRAEMLVPEVRAMICELQSLRSKPVAGVEVKPLEWKSEDIGWTAETELGEWVIDHDDDEDVADAPWSAWGPQESIGHFSSEKGAKAAAEVDYRQRILSTLSLPAQEPVRRDGWRQRLEDLATEIEIGNATAAAAIVEELLEGLSDVEEMATIAPQPEAVKDGE